MNQRIQELMKQANKDIPLGKPFWSALEEFSEKFSELIVTECIAITDELVNRDRDGSWTTTELYTDYNGALSEVKRRITEHFGVEL